MTAPSPFRQIGIVGTGRLARALAFGLGQKLGPQTATPPLLWGRNPDHAARVEGCVPVGDPGTLAQSCDVIAIAVSDDAIPAVVAALAQAGGFRQAPLVFHASGNSGSAILSPLRQLGALTAAIHPAMTFTGAPSVEVARMAGACFAVTGSTPQAATRAHAFVGMLGGTCVDIAEEQRTLYHAALCHAANHLVTLLAGAAQALRAAGAEDPAGLLGPLVRASLENGLERGIEALSGPVLRGDTKTVAGHLKAIADSCPELLVSYRTMATATVEALERHDPATPRTEMRNILEQP